MSPKCIITAKAPSVAIACQTVPFLVICRHVQNSHRTRIVAASGPSVELLREREAVRPPLLERLQTKEQQVAEFLREGILAGEFARGQKLKQAAIAKRLDISITPVREAMKLLEAEGYIHVSAHRGAVVAPFQIERVDELFQLRLSMEGRLTLAATTQAATPNEDIDELIAD